MINKNNITEIELIKNIEQISNQISSIWIEIKNNEIEHIENSWNGKSKQAFINQVENLEYYFNNITSQLEQLQNTIKRNNLVEDEGDINGVQSE